MVEQLTLNQWVQSSSLCGCTKYFDYGCSSVGRALVSKTRCREFEPYHPCDIGALVQLVRIHACHAWGHGFESRTHRISRSGAVVARQAHNLEVSGSIPLSATIYAARIFVYCENSSVGRARPCQGRGRGFESRFSLNNLFCGGGEIGRHATLRG